MDAAVAACFQEFCTGIIDAVAEVAACVKPQAAFFEQYGAAGWKALAAVILAAPTSTTCPSSSTSSAATSPRPEPPTASAMFGGAPGFAGPAPGIGADAITASPYLGDDSLQPLVDHCASGHGVFILDAHEQSRRRPCCRSVAPMAGRISAGGRPLPSSSAPGHVCDAGYSDGGASRRRHGAGAAARRARGCLAGIPSPARAGVRRAAQGAVRHALAGVAALAHAVGFVVTAPRSIIFAWQQGGGDYRRAAATAAESMRSDLQDSM